MTSPTSTPQANPLEIAIEAEQSLWAPSDAQPARWLSVRDNAIRAAVESGYSRDEVASALRMQTNDIDRILSS